MCSNKDIQSKKCKYCHTVYIDCTDEGLSCIDCNEFVHLKCLKRGAVPGGLVGDIFFDFTCAECSITGVERFVRDKMPWLQAILLAIHHMQRRSSGIAKKGYFHWKVHIGAFIDKHWDVIFKREFKRKKNWMGTIAGTLSLNSPCFFKSGTETLNEQGWWTITFSKLTPNVILQLNAELVIAKQKCKDLKLPTDDIELLKEVLANRSYNLDELLQSPNLTDDNDDAQSSEEILQPKLLEQKRKSLLPMVETFTKKIKPDLDFYVKETTGNAEISLRPHFLNPFCLYIVSLKSLTNQEVRLTGNIREDFICSSYSRRLIPPYIFKLRDINPHWLQLMDELVLKVNSKDFQLRPRSTLDFVYVQPELIPAVNTLCSQLFWNGIDVSQVLEYPDFSCVVLYRKLVVACAFLIPDVNKNESYLSLICTRTGWRNSGIAKYMLYHLTQTNYGRDITLHVAKNSEALFLFNKFHFKPESVVKNFYNQYNREEKKESEHAFYCRLDR